MGERDKGEGGREQGERCGGGEGGAAGAQPHMEGELSSVEYCGM